MNTFPPHGGDDRLTHKRLNKWALVLVAGVVVFLVVFGYLFARYPGVRGDQATWFSGIATAVAVFVALGVARRDGQNQARNERVRREEVADREASIARTVTSTVINGQELFYGGDAGDEPQWQPVIVVTVTNHGAEPVLALNVEQVEASGPDTTGVLTLSNLPRAHAIPPESLAFFNNVQDVSAVIPVLAPGASVRFAGIYVGASGKQLPGLLSNVSDADISGMSATIHFTDGRGLAWGRKGVGPPQNGDRIKSPLAP